MDTKNTWTEFMDMHSGGGSKESFEYLYIEAPEEEAKIIFYNRFGHSPERVSCTCCGEDYSISSDESLEQATGYRRGCRFAYFKGDEEIPESNAFVIGKGQINGIVGKFLEESNPKWSYNDYIELGEYLKRDDVKIIYATDIKPEERIGDLPQEGYVWV